MTTGVVCTPPILQFTLNNGQPAAGGSILTQVGGVNTATYADSGLTTPLPNPIPLNSRGEISTAAGASSQLFLTPNTVYVFTLFDGPNGMGNQIWQASYVNGVQISQATIGSSLYPRTAAEISVGITPTNFVYPSGNVLRYGAAGDGATDDTVAVQSAINVAQVTCGTVYIPATTASYKVTASLTITAGVRIAGDGFSPYTPNDFNTRGPGSWLQLAHLGKGFTINNGGGDVTSVLLQQIGTLRNQPAPGVGWTPIAADYDIYIGNADVHIIDVMIWNPTLGVQINSASGARVDIDGLYGQPLQIGIDCLLAEDVVRIRNVHFWPYWDNDVTYVQAYMRLNLEALQFERCDNPIISDFFCILAKWGINFTSSANGITARAQLTNIGIDTFQTAAIIVQTGADGTSFQVSNLYGFSGSNSNNGIIVNANNCLIQALGVRFSELGFSASSINGTGNQAIYTNWIVDGYNGANNGSACFFTNAGCKTTISDRVIATATNASALINSTLTNYNAIVAEGSFSFSAATSVVITHGLNWTPFNYQIGLQFNGSGAGGISFYVDTITSTQFTIHATGSVTVNGTWVIDGRTT